VADPTEREVIIELKPAASDMDAATSAVAVGRGRTAVRLDTDFEPLQLPRLELLDVELKTDVDPTAVAPPVDIDLSSSATTQPTASPRSRRWRPAMACQSRPSTRATAWC
jgi:hypothetical protein